MSSYFLRVLPDEPKKKHYTDAVNKTLEKHPDIIDFYIKYKELNGGGEAIKSSLDKIDSTETLLIKNVKALADYLENHSQFYTQGWDTFDETYQRLMFLKSTIENNDGYRIFFIKGKPVKREADLQLLFKLTWFATPSDVNSEVNNGRGPVDFKISRGFKDKTLVEFKLASNTKLKQNLKKQTKIYEAANGTKKTITAILYFSETELIKVQSILKELHIKESKTLVLIDAQPDKPSGSKAK